MQKSTILLFLAFSVSSASAQTLTFSCTNPVAGAGELTFDILVTPDASAISDSLGDLQVYLDYNTAALGSNIAGSSSYAVGGDMNTASTGLYSTNVINNNSPSRISLDLSFEDTRAGIPPITPPIFPVELQTAVDVEIMTVTVPVIDTNEMTNLSFNVGLMAGQQFYEPPPPALPIALFSVDPGSACDVDGQLPVELAELFATTEGQSINISWATLSEQNNTGFELQQINRNEWHVVDFIESQGNTQTGHSYSYTVNSVAPGKHSFRLKQTDLDGSFEYSSVIETTVEIGTAFVVETYPNPFATASTVTIAVAETQHIRVAVFDALGRQLSVLFDETLEANQLKSLRWPAHDSANGLYIYRITGDRFSETRTAVLAR